MFHPEYVVLGTVPLHKTSVTWEEFAAKLMYVAGDTEERRVQIREGRWTFMRALAEEVGLMSAPEEYNGRVVR